jgi:hypothetical protein
LTDVLGARACLQQAKLCDRLIAFRRGALNRQCRVPGIQASDEIADGEPVPLVHFEIDNATTDFGRDPDFGRLNVTGRAQLIRRAAITTRDSRGYAPDCGD